MNWQRPGLGMSGGAAVLLISLSSALLPPLLAQAGPAGDAGRDAFIRHMMREAGMPGVQAVIVKQGKIVWQRSYGYAVLSQPGPIRPMRNNSLLFTASLGKIPTAIVVMQLVEQGTIRLDDDINGSVPFPVRNPRWPDLPITWRMLLTHTSSIEDPEDVLDSLYTYGRDTEETLDQCVERVFESGGASYRTTLYGDRKPGTQRVYSNFAIDLVGYAVARVTHESFASHVRKAVFDPLAMTETSFFLRGLPVDRLAVGYGRTRTRAGGYRFEANGIRFGHRPAGHSVLDEMFTAPDLPSGMIFTSAVEYARLMMMLLNGGTLAGQRILTPASVDSLLSPSGFWSIYGYQQGLVLYATRNLQEHLVWGHDGQDRGYVTALFFDRDAGLGAIAFANGNSDDEELSRYLVDLDLHLMESVRPPSH